jgi:hypothetical protein
MCGYEDRRTTFTGTPSRAHSPGNERHSCFSMARSHEGYA